MRAEDRANLIILTVALFIVSQTMQCIALTLQCFYLRGNKDPSVLLPTRDKKIAVIFQKNHMLNLRNQYHKGAT